MDINEIISKISPINTNEKVDFLIQKMNEKRVVMTNKIDIAIRFAIKKMSVQKYFINKYGPSIIKEDNKKEGKRNFKKSGAKIDTKKLKRTTEEKKKAKDCGYVPSIIRTFGSEFKKINKKLKKENKSCLTEKLKMGPTATTRSIHPIYIASGGLNKRW